MADQNSLAGQAAGSTAADGDGLDTLLPIVYEELHALAVAVLARSRVIDPTRTTSLIHDVYVRLANRGLRFRDRGHFLCLAAKAMRCVLLDRARRESADKRGGGAKPIELHEEIVPAAEGPDLLALNDALSRLAKIDALKAQIVELRFFGGLSVDESAEVAGLSAATVKREWLLAKAWLFRELGHNSPPDS